MLLCSLQVTCIVSLLLDPSTVVLSEGSYFPFRIFVCLFVFFTPEDFTSVHFFKAQRDNMQTVILGYTKTICFNFWPGVKSSRHGEEHPCLDICGFYLLLWPGNYSSRVSIIWRAGHRWWSLGSYSDHSAETSGPALLYVGIWLWLTSLQPLTGCCSLSSPPTTEHWCYVMPFYPICQ